MNPPKGISRTRLGKTAPGLSRALKEPKIQVAPRIGEHPVITKFSIGAKKPGADASTFVGVGLKPVAPDSVRKRFRAPGTFTYRFVDGRVMKTSAQSSTKGAVADPSTKETISEDVHTAGPLEGLRGLPPRTMIRRAWEHGIPMRRGPGGQDVVVYSAAKTGSATRLSKSEHAFFETFQKNMEGIRGGRRQKRRLDLIKKIYEVADSSGRSELMKSLESMNRFLVRHKGTAGAKLPITSKRVREGLNDIIAEHGREVGRLPIELKAMVGVGRPKDKIPGQYRHYTDKAGLMEILRTGRLSMKPGADGRIPKVYLTDLDLSPTEVWRTLFLGNEHYKGRGEYVVSFDIDSGVTLSQGCRLKVVNGEPVYEYYADIPLRVGRDIKIHYAGQNPIVPETSY